MKIVFITDNFPAEVNALAIKIFEHCIKWVKWCNLGHCKLFGIKVYNCHIY